MKKTYLMVLLCVPLLLFLGFKTSKAVVGQGAQAPGPSWGMETDNISMAEVGKLLERLGKEIQEKGAFTAGGKTFALEGNGSIEWNARSMRGGTTLHLEIGTSAQPRRGKVYVAYDVSGGRPATAAEAAEVLAKIAKALASKDAIIIDEHSVALEGSIGISQRLIEMTRGGRGRGMPYGYTFDVFLGDGRFPVPQDEQDDVEMEQRGWVKELAIKQTMNVKKDVVVKMFEQLSADLKEGNVKIGETSLPAGDNIQFNLSHLVTTEGNGHRVRFAMQFGPMPARTRQTGPRYNKELFDEPMKNVGTLLKQMGTEILEKGAFKLGENEFKVQELATYEISASSRGFSIELSYIETNKDK